MSLGTEELRKNSEKAKEYFMNILAYTLGPTELKDMLDSGSIKVVDVRKKEAYDNGHIPTAISIPKDELAERIGELSKDELTIVYCCNQQCHMGAKAALILADYGYPVMLMEGGYKVWTEDFRYAVVAS